MGAEEFCDIYGNAVVMSTIKYRLSKFYVELSDNNDEDISEENKILEYIFYPSKFNNEESIKIEEQLFKYNYNFKYIGTEKPMNVKQMMELFKTQQTTLDDVSYFNFVNNYFSITEFIPDEYENARNIIYNYIWEL